jgi:cytochrome c biogenesis protein CcdA
LTDLLLELLATNAAYAPLFGLALGVALSLSPASLPALTVSVAALAPGRLGGEGEREHLPLRRSFTTLLAFVAGMDGVLAAAAYFLVSVTIVLTRASVALHVLAAVILVVLGLRLVWGRASLCGRAQRIPPEPTRAFAFGVLFSVTGCPGCGPVVVGLTSVTVIVVGPGAALFVLGAFLLARTLTLLAVARAGSHLLPVATANVAWRRLDLVVGALFLLAGIYYGALVATGRVTTLLPGEPGILA